MRRNPLTVLGAATVVAALGLSGCSAPAETKIAAEPGGAAGRRAGRPAARRRRPAAAPEALTDVMYRLADPAVPGKDKLDLVENTTADEAGTIDRFAAALRDGGFTPLTFAASEIRWSDHQPGDAPWRPSTSRRPTRSNPGGFTFPMEFRPHNGGWQLSRETADMLLGIRQRPNRGRPDHQSRPAAVGPAWGWAGWSSTSCSVTCTR